MEATFDRTGLTLAAVRDLKCVTTREVADELGVSLSTARRELEGLEDAGLVRGVDRCIVLYLDMAKSGRVVRRMESDVIRAKWGRCPHQGAKDRER